MSEWWLSKIFKCWTVYFKGEEHLTAYEFNTKQAKHMFCKVCGVQSFYQPRSNSDGWGQNLSMIYSYQNLFSPLYLIFVGVMPHCIDSNTIVSTIYESFDGDNWELSLEKDTVIQALSKTWQEMKAIDKLSWVVTFIDSIWLRIKNKKKNKYCK